MIVQNPLVPPPTALGNTPSPVANVPKADDTSEAETNRPVTANQSSERSQAEERRSEPQSDRPRERGAELDITV